MLDKEGQERAPLLPEHGESITGGFLLTSKYRQVPVTEVHQEHAEEPPFNPFHTFFVFLFPALGGLLFGYDIGGTSAVLAQLKDDTLSGVTWSGVIAGSPLLQGVITSSGVFGAMLGSIICFRIGDIIGRRVELLIAGSLYLSGSLIEAASGASSWGAAAGISVLMLGRLTYGLGCGFAMHGAPAYIGEMAPSSVRGIMVSMKEAMIVVGIVMGYLLGWIFEASEGRWRVIYGLAAFPAVCMLLGMLRLPPSARWLVLKGRMEEARRSLQFVTPDISEAALDEIQAAADRGHDESTMPAGDDVGGGGGGDGITNGSSHSNGNGYSAHDKRSSKNSNNKGKGGRWASKKSAFASMFDGLSSPSCRPALVVGVGLVVLQQVTGQPSVLYYADSLFQDVGMGNSASVLVGLFKLVATLLAVFTVDGQGRRKLLKLGCTLMLMGLLVLGVCFLFPYSGADDCAAVTSEDDCVDGCTWTADCVCDGSSSTDCDCCGLESTLDVQKGFILAAMFIYIGGYQVGFGPVSWLIISEVFPLDVRGKAISIAVVMNFFSNVVVTFLFPSMMDVLGISLTFFIFAAVDVYAIFFIQTRVPETKGLSLEEIEQMFAKLGRSSRSRSSVI